MSNDLIQHNIDSLFEVIGCVLPHKEHMESGAALTNAISLIDYCCMIGTKCAEPVVSPPSWLCAAGFADRLLPIEILEESLKKHHIIAKLFNVWEEKMSQSSEDRVAAACARTMSEILSCCKWHSKTLLTNAPFTPPQCHQHQRPCGLRPAAWLSFVPPSVATAKHVPWRCHALPALQRR